MSVGSTRSGSFEDLLPDDSELNPRRLLLRVGEVALEDGREDGLERAGVPGIDT